MKRAGLILAVLLVVAAGFSLLAWRQYQAFLATPLSIPRGGIVFELLEEHAVARDFPLGLPVRAARTRADPRLEMLRCRHRPGHGP